MYGRSQHSEFFSENDSRGEKIDYEAAVLGHIQLVPTGDTCALLAQDYKIMLNDGVLLDDFEPFDSLIAQFAQIESEVNAFKSANN